MIKVTVEGKFDLNDKYYGSSEIARMAIRYIFECDQRAKGNWQNIRVTRKFVKCTLDGDIGFLDSIEKENPVYWRNNILIIKGEIVVPALKDIVKTFDID